MGRGPRPARWDHRPLAAALSPVAVTFVSSHALLGGSEKYLETLLGQLGREWIHGVVSLQDGPANDRFAAVGPEPVVLHTSGSKLDLLRASLRLRAVLVGQRPDVVHANGVKAALICALATFGLRVPVIWVKHDFSWDGPLVKAIALRCAEVVAVSAAVTEALPRRARVSVVRLGVEPYPLDREASRVFVREMLGVPPDAPVVLLAGRLHPVKGHHELLAVVPPLVESVPGVRFLLIGGDDPNQAEYGAGVRRRAAELGRAVTLVGHRDDALGLIGGSDAMVVPSVRDDHGMGREGSSLVTVEAMAMGTAVVAYADGGMPEVLGECGRLVPPGDRPRLADAIAEILLDRRLASSLRDCARARAAERFCLAANTEMMKDRYRAVARRW